jgi:hypothetical protein
MTSEHARPLSIEETYAGRHVLLTGGSGFLGKVWLAMLLEHVPDIGRIYLLVRSKALVSGQQRVQNMLNSSPAFRTLHEKLGAGFGDYVNARLEVVEGELSDPGLAMDPAVRRRLLGQLDLVVHCAGLVDFDPDLRKALGSNVYGTLHVADFVEACDSASMLHISTCYVAGARQGAVPETLHENYAPIDDGFDVERELGDAMQAIERICATEQSPEARDEVDREVHAMIRERRTGHNEKLASNLVQRRLRERLRDALSREGMQRARRWGWPNTYTYSKSMAESLLARRVGRIRLAVLRPTIVESARAYPFPGWNESFNGSAPLAYVMGSWFRMVPARPDAPFDVVPVDEVCKGMVVSGAHLLRDVHAPVYQIGSSDRNRCSVGRAAELIVLAHRHYYRGEGRTRNERVLKSRWDSILVEPDVLFSNPNMRSLVKGFDEMLDLLPRKLRKRVARHQERAREIDGTLGDIQKMIDLYLPFMYENFHVFEGRAIERVPIAEAFFRFDIRSLDWRDYWIHTHMPGLRRWAFPLIEGRRPERYRTAHPLTLREPQLEASVQPRRAAMAGE